MTVRSRRCWSACFGGPDQLAELSCSTIRRIIDRRATPGSADVASHGSNDARSAAPRHNGPPSAPSSPEQHQEHQHGGNRDDYPHPWLHDLSPSSSIRPLPRWPSCEPRQLCQSARNQSRHLTHWGGRCPARARTRRWVEFSEQASDEEGKGWQTRGHPAPPGSSLAGCSKPSSDLRVGRDSASAAARHRSTLAHSGTPASVAASSNASCIATPSS